MSKSTPRQCRHRHLSNSGPRATSDYESDAAYYMETREHAPAPHRPGRTNTDLNLAVLRRYLPRTRAILSVTANAVVYSFSHATQAWDKHGVEGTMFVLDVAPDPHTHPTSTTRPYVFVLNRRGLENLMVDLMHVSHCEVLGELIIFRIRDDKGHAQIGQSVREPEPEQEPEQEREQEPEQEREQEPEQEPERVIGVWIHAVAADTREVNWKVIEGAWKQARMPLMGTQEGIRSAHEQTATGGVSLMTTVHTETRVHEVGGGRRLSITDLFAQIKAT